MGTVLLKFLNPFTSLKFIFLQTSLGYLISTIYKCESGPVQLDTSLTDTCGLGLAGDILAVWFRFGFQPSSSGFSSPLFSSQRIILFNLGEYIVFFVYLHLFVLASIFLSIGVKTKKCCKKYFILNWSSLVKVNHEFLKLVFF